MEARASGPSAAPVRDRSRGWSDAWIRRGGRGRRSRRAGLLWARLVCARPDWARLDCARPDWARLDWARLDWARLDWARLDWERVGRAACGAAIAVAILLGAAHGVALGLTLEARDVASALLGLGLGALAQDLLTGGVHWSCDTWGDARTRGLGPHLIRWFREHHRDPQGIVARDWVWVNREPGILAGATLALLWLPGLQASLAASPFAYAAVLAFAAYGGAANQIHQWAHRERAPAPVRAAQRLRLLLPPDAHARHHRGPHRSAYCISTGWLNPWLDRWRVWTALERAVTRLTGAMPRRPRTRAGRMERDERERSSA